MNVSTLNELSMFGCYFTHNMVMGSDAEDEVVKDKEQDNKEEQGSVRNDIMKNMKVET